MRSTLTTFGAVVQSYVDQGVLPRNVIALVDRPKDVDPDGTEDDGKSWTLAEVLRFRESVRDHRLSGCDGRRSISTPARCRSGVAASPSAARASRADRSRNGPTACYRCPPTWSRLSRR